MSGPSRDDKLRLSLQPKSVVEAPSPLRHTQSQNYGVVRESAKKRRLKKNMPPAIPEIELTEVDETDTRNITINLGPPRQSVVKVSKSGRRQSAASSTNSISNNRHHHDNLAFERDADQRSVSMANVSLNASTKELGVVREQYCCCSRWTRCERILCVTLNLLLLLILLMTIAIVVLGGIVEDCTGKAPTLSTIVNIREWRKNL